MKYISLTLLLCLTGCWSGRVNPNVANQGYHTETIKKAAVVHEKALGNINERATEITEITDKKKVRTAATEILQEAAKIDNVTEMLRVESESKKAYEEKITEMDAEITKLNDEKNSMYSRITGIMKIIGFLLIPAGLVLAWKLSGEFIALSAFGGAVIVTSFIVRLLERFGTLIAILAVIAIGYAVWYMYFVQRRSLSEAVGFAESMKQVAKKKDPDAVKLIVGDGAIPGTTTQHNSSIKQIKQIRKKIEK